METRTQKEMQSKYDQIIQDCFIKSIQIILQSRIPVKGEPSAKSLSLPSSRGGPRDCRFNLALGDCPAAVSALEVCNTNGFRSIVLDVLLVQSKQQQTVDQSDFKLGKIDKLWRTVTPQQEDRKSVMERWILQYLSRDDGQNAGSHTSGTEEVPVVYKSIMILLRSLFCMSRVLPAYRLFQLANCSSYGNLFALSYRFLPLPRPFLHGESIKMKSYKFTPIEASFGKICLSVDFRSIVASDMKIPSETRLPKIMPDYIGSPTTDRFKKLSDHRSTNLMLNFGGYLPLDRSVLPAIPHDSCREKNLSYQKCITTRHGYSYPQGGLQKSLSHKALGKSLSCRGSSRWIEFSTEAQFNAVTQLTRQTKSLSGTTSGVKAGLMASGAHTDDWNDVAEVGNFSFPFAIDDCYSGKFFNRDISMDEVLDSFTSSQNPQTSEAMVKEAKEFQYSSRAAIGAIVQLLKSAPPLQQSTTLVNSDAFSKSSKLPSQKGTDENIFLCPHKLETSRLLKKQSFVIPNCQQEGTTGSYSKKTAGQALKELDRYKDIKNQILSKGKSNTTQD